MLYSWYNDNFEAVGIVPAAKRQKPVMFYHGTTPEKAAAILMQGVDLHAPKSHDSGDFGNGFYLTLDKTRAKHMGGPAILEVTVDLKFFAYIPNPYFLDKLQQVPPRNKVQELFYCAAFDNKGEMATIHGDKAAGLTRQQVCNAVQSTMLANGFKGLHTEYHGCETVVYDTRVIKSIAWRRG